jgi:hypothetical protein
MSDPTSIRCWYCAVEPIAVHDVTRCAYRAGEQLHEIADMAGAARDIAHGLSSRQSGSAAAGKPGSRLPLDLAATARLDAVEAELATWARHVSAERGVPLP